MKTDNPGPGSYEQSRKTTGPKAVMTARYNKEKISNKDFVPGPGQYNVNLEGKHAANAHKYSIGGKLRHNDERVSVPGPGSYNTDRSRPKTGVKFGSESRKGFVDSGNKNAPGPGSYGLQTSEYKTSTAPKYT